MDLDLTTKTTEDVTPVDVRYCFKIIGFDNIQLINETPTPSSFHQNAIYATLIYKSVALGFLPTEDLTLHM